MHRPYTSYVFFISVFGVILSIGIREVYDGFAFLFTIIAVIMFVMVKIEIEDSRKEE